MLKPGHPLPAKDAARDQFILSVIEALQKADGSSQSSTKASQRDQAISAYRALQYDFPDVPACELASLAAAIRKQLSAGGLPTSFGPTNKLLANIKLCASAQRADAPPTTSDAAGSPSDSVRDKVTHSEADAAPAAVGHGDVAAGNGMQLLRRAEDDTPANRRHAYQELQGLFLLRCVALALSAPSPEAMKFVRKVVPPVLESEQDALHNDAESRATSTTSSADRDPYMHATANGHARSGAPANNGSCASVAAPAASSNGSAGDAVLRTIAAQDGNDLDGVSEDRHTASDKLCAEQDSDDVPYEALEAAPSGMMSTHASLADSRERHDLSADDSHAADLETRLSFMVSHLSDALLECERAWQEDDLMLEACKALAQIAKSSSPHPQLQLVYHILAKLVTERLTRSPADLHHLPTLLHSLGMPLNSPAAPNSSKSSRTARSHAATARAAGPALGLCATLAGASAAMAESDRAVLWSHFSRGGVLPICAAVLEGLESTSRGCGELDANSAADVDAVCAVVEFYVMNCPGGAQVGALQKSGVLRPLVVLFSTVGGATQSESLRRALILTCARSKEACTWFSGHLPAREAALQGAAFQRGGCADVHGAVWPVVLAQGRTPAKLDDVSCTLLGLLLPELCCEAQIARLLYLLQLMHSLQRLGQGRIVWPTPVGIALQSLMDTLQRMASAERRAEVTGPLEVQEDTTADDVKREPGDHGILKSAALAPRCIMLIKSLTIRDAGSSKFD